MPSQNPVPSAPRFSIEVFLGVVWAGLSLVTIFVAFRIYFRIRKFRRLFVDDVLVLFAWVLVLVSSVLWQIYAHQMFLIYAVARGVESPPIDFTQRTESFRKAATVNLVFFYTTLWSIKFSFLFFFRRLYQDLRSGMRFWWVAFAVTAATWVVSLCTPSDKCWVQPWQEIVAHCSEASAIRYQKTVVIISCVFDVVTDAMITVIPIAILCKVRIGIQKKVSLGIIFAANVLTMAVAITRAASFSASWYRQDTTWLYFWANIETIAALFVSSLGSFRSLFVSQDSKPRISDDAPHTIGSPPKRTKLDSIAQILGSYVSNKSSSRVSNGYIDLEDVQRNYT